MPKLGFFTKLWFGVGQMSEGMKNASFASFLLILYSQVLGMPAIVASAVLAISLAIDAISDPLTGSVSDAFQHRWGRRHPFMYAAALPMGITFALAFHPPQDAPTWLLAVWMLTFTVLARVSMTVYSVPHMSLGAELSSDYHERTVVVAFRNFFGLLGAAVLLSACAFYFMRSTDAYEHGQLNPDAYGPMGICFGVLIAAFILISALGTHSRIPHLPRPGKVAALSFGRLSREIREALENHSFRMLFCGLLIFFVARGTADSLGLYMGTFFWKLATRDVIMIGASSLIGMVLGTPIWAIVARRFDKKQIFLVGICWFSLLTALLPLLKIVGWFPAEDSASYVGTIYLFVFVAALGAAGSLVAAGSMLADIADQHELSVGRRQEGIFFGALAFSAKAAIGVGLGLSGVMLTLIEFPLQVAPEQVDPQTVLLLGICAGPGVAVLMAIGIVVMGRYSLTREQVHEVQRALAERAATTVRLARDEEAPVAIAASGIGG